MVANAKRDSQSDSQSEEEEGEHFVVVPILRFSRGWENQFRKSECCTCLEETREVLKVHGRSESRIVGAGSVIFDSRNMRVSK